MMNTKKATPCLNCEKREPGCHSKCEDYEKYKEKRREMRQRRYEEQQRRIHI